MLKRVKILDFIISGCILYTKISGMVIFGLVFLEQLIYSYIIWFGCLLLGNANGGTD